MRVQACRWRITGLTLALVALPVAEPRGQDAAATSRQPVAVERELHRRDLMIESLLRRIERLENGESPDVTAEGTDEPRPKGTIGIVNSSPAERALERTLTRGGALLLPRGQFEIEPALGYTHSDAGGPVFLAEGDSNVVFIGENAVDRDELRASAELRAGLPGDAQFEVELPYEIVMQSAATEVGQVVQGRDDRYGAGLGDVTLGLAKTVLRENGFMPDLVARVFWDTGSGERSDDGVGLSGGFAGLGGSLTFLKRQDPLAFVGSLGFEQPLKNDGIEPGRVYSVSLGTVLAASPETSLRLGFTHQFVDDVRADGEVLDGSDATLGVLSLGVSSLLGRSILLDLAFDVGLTDEAADYAVRVAMPIRFGF